MVVQAHYRCMANAVIADVFVLRHTSSDVARVGGCNGLDWERRPMEHGGGGMVVVL